MAVMIGEFLERLEATGILDESVLGEVRSEADRHGGVDADAETFVKELHSSGRLTAFQAKVLWKDRGSQLVLGNYVVEEELGRGGMGVVLKAHHRVMQRRVAIKMLPAKVSKDASAIARFEREVRAAAQLMHPNIVAAHDADEFDGRHALIMEFVDGRDLSSVVKKKGPLSVEQALDCVIQAARGLEFAHGKGVVHRDIKPANLLLDSKGSVKILDMGLARFSEAADVGSVAELTGTGTIMGTVDYMSPEQAISTRNADERSDVYSLGITLWYLLTAKPVYEGDSLMSRMMAHANDPIPRLREVRPDVPESVEAVFERMVAKAPEERLQTMTEVVAALEACRGDESGTVVTAHAKGSGDSSTADGLSDFLGSFDEEGADNAAGATTSGTSTKRKRGRRRLGAPDLDSQTAVASATSGTIRSRPALSRTKRVRESKLPPWATDWRVLAGAGGGFLAIVLLIAAFSGPEQPDGAKESETPTTTEIARASGADDGAGGDVGQPVSPAASDVPSGRSPDGWRPIFDGKSLDGWERFGGKDGDWRVENGVLVGTGSNTRLVYTRDEFEDVAVRVRCRLADGANSGLYLRAEKNQSWNNGYEAQLAFLGSKGTLSQFRIGSIWKYGPFSKQLLDPSETFDLEFEAVDNRLRVRVNGVETVDVTDDTFEKGHIALQGHNSGKRIEFERIEVRDVRTTTEPPYVPPPATTASTWTDLFNGRDLTGFEVVGTRGWSVRSGAIVADGSGTGWLGTAGDYGNFEFEVEYRLPIKGNSGILLRVDSGSLSASDDSGAVEIQLLDDARHPAAKEVIRTGSVHKHVARTQRPNTSPNTWHRAHVRVEVRHVTVTHDGTTVLDTTVPASILGTRPGRVGLQMWRTPVEFRGVRIRRLP